LRKSPLQKWAGRVAQAVESLSSKHEALSSNPSASGKKKKKKTGTSSFGQVTPPRDLEHNEMLEFVCKSAQPGIGLEQQKD
jgi:hypothetical protein